MGKGAPEPPPAPNYQQIAQTQGELDKQVAAQQNYANRPSQVTPWGSQTWNTDVQIDPATGQPVTTWTQNTQLNPQAQQALNSQLDIQQGLSGLASGFQGRVADAYAQPLDWASLPQQGRLNMGALPATGTIGDAGTGIDRALADIHELRAPEVEARRSAVETQLANQGITAGSQADDTAMRRLADQEARDSLLAQTQAGQFADAQQRRELNAAQYANQLRQMGFGEQQAAANYANQIRQQSLAEAQLARGMPLNEMNALLTGQQVGMPAMPDFQRGAAYRAPNVLGAADRAYNADIDAYNVQAGNYGNQMSGLFGLGRAAIGAVPFLF